MNSLVKNNTKQVFSNNYYAVKKENILWDLYNSENELIHENAINFHVYNQGYYDVLI